VLTYFFNVHAESDSIVLRSKSIL